MSQQVECPRCRMRRSVALHRIMATDAQECPRCWGKDQVEVPMAIFPPRWKHEDAAAIQADSPLDSLDR